MVGPYPNCWVIDPFLKGQKETPGSYKSHVFSSVSRSAAALQAY